MSKVYVELKVVLDYLSGKRKNALSSVSRTEFFRSWLSFVGGVKKESKLGYILSLS